MPVDYSKWDKLDLSDDEEEETKKVVSKPAVAAVKEPVKPAAPKDAAGSAWNASNYHFEEQKLDSWGRDKIRSILSDGKVSYELQFNDLRPDFKFSFSPSKVEGDCWTHIRKGKSSVGFNMEVECAVLGQVTTSSREENIDGKITADIMVDDDDFGLNLEVTKGNDLPFYSQIRKLIESEFRSRVKKFVQELEAKAQKQREQADAHGKAQVKKAEEQAAAAKSHFGGRVQVGGHNPDGLKLSS